MTSFGRDKSRLAVEKIGDHLMEEVRKTYPILSDDLLSLLNFIFQGPLLSALDLVEKRSVTRVSSPSGRELFQIIGASGTPYTCFHHLKYCSCPAYHFSVLCKEEHIMCKHVLAMKLSEAMGLTKSLQVSDAEITNMIMAIE
uniref:SWIM-type domain-containing protein n=1 Tax=Arion vulgaris TaxID=1028688 RepID=A0A0B7B3P7_9EUPU